MRVSRRVLACAVSVLLSVPLAAHDFWIEPASFRPAPDARVAIQLRVGERFAGDDVPRKPEKIESFASWSFVPAKRESPAERSLVEAEPIVTPVPGIDGQAPAGIWRANASGVVWIAYRSKVTPIELEAAKFERYLREEGLEHVVDARARAGASEKPGKELYSRCAKALLVVAPSGADASHAGFDRVLGLTLELVPVNDPSTLRPGDTLTLRVLHAGQPLANALVGVQSKTAPANEVRARTDADGRATFTLGASGPTLARVVHMVPAPAGSGADWESLWASLTFDALAAVPPAPAPPVPAPR